MEVITTDGGNSCHDSSENCKSTGFGDKLFKQEIGLWYRMFRIRGSPLNLKGCVKMKKFRRVLVLFGIGILLSSVFATVSATNHYKLLTHNDQEFISFDMDTIFFKHDQTLNADFIDIRIKHEFSPAGLKAYIQSRKEANFTYPGLDNLNYFIDHQLYSPNHSYCLLETTDYSKDDKILFRNTVTQILWRKIDLKSVGALMYNGILSYTMQNYAAIKKRS